MATLFHLRIKRRRVDLQTLTEHQKQAENERLHSEGPENPTRGIRGGGANMNNELDESYIEMALGKYERIKSIVSNGRRPTRSEKELISMIFNKMVDPYYYWAEGRVKGENENVGNKDPKESGIKEISELVTKYDLDISEMNSTPSRIKLKRYLDKGFEELNARMKKIGYSYERGSRSFVK
jgi:hypothetical protein